MATTIPVALALLFGVSSEAVGPARGADPASFRPPVIYPGGSTYLGAGLLTVGDFTGDGRNDVAVATVQHTIPPSPDDLKLLVYAQTPTGTLTRVAAYPLPGHPGAMAAGDINGDGRVDVAVGTIQSDAQTWHITLFRQNVGGSFDAGTIAGTRVEQLRIADLDGDGRDDLAALNLANGIVAVFFQDASGQLGAPVPHPVSFSTRRFELADLGGDGLTDIVTLAGLGSVPLAVRHQLPGGGFGPSQPLDVPLPANQVRNELTVGDLDADGLPDLVVTHGGNLPAAGVTRARQLPGGTFATEVLATLDIPSGIVFADVNADGRLDVAVRHPASVATGVYYQNPDGSLRPEHRIETAWSNANDHTSLAVLDIDSNGTLDVVEASNGAGVVVIAQNTADPAVVTVATPSGTVYEGVPVELQWTASSATPLQHIDLLHAEVWYVPHEPIAECTGLPGTETRCTWLSPGPAAAQSRIRVDATDTAGNVGWGTATFSIVTPTITVTHPSMPADWGIGSARAVTWTSNLPPTDSVTVSISRDGGATWTDIGAAVPNTGRFDWRATGPSAGACRIRVAWDAAPAIADTSDVDFSISAPFVLVTSPDTGGIWPIGMTQEIRWSHNLGTMEASDIELSRDDGTSWSTLATGVVHSANTDASYSWLVTGPAAKRARIRVRWSANGAILDSSDLPFVISDTSPFPVPALLERPSGRRP